MTVQLFVAENAHVPLTEEEKRGLIPGHITLRSELYEAEQAGLLSATGWALLRARNVLDERFLCRLHREMFKNLWQWAGEYSREPRRRPIGVNCDEIRPAVNHLLGNVQDWTANKTFPPDEIAVRFHHGLVFIHSFPNGNTRHARLATDLLLKASGQPLFTWGQETIGTASGATRNNYTAALRAADNHDFSALLKFARS